MKLSRIGLALFVFGCSRPAPVASSVPPPLPAPHDGDAAPLPSSPPTPSTSTAIPEPAASPRPTPTRTALSLATVREALFLDDPKTPECAPVQADGGAPSRVHCLLAARYADDPKAQSTATLLYDTTGDIAGLSPPETMNGGFRGQLHLVPELPTGAREKHLEWVAAAATDYDDFFARLHGSSVDAGAGAGDDGRGGAGLYPYRWRDLTFRFMRSVKRTTPSAHALGWSIAYNVDGSLNTGKDAVRELLFHEIFHLNDAAHGDWSTHALGPTFDAITRRCHSTVSCLTPYAPTAMQVRGGTYYAFQENNGEAVHEYAAELALRYYREQRAVLRGEPTGKRFKCGPPENANAWRLLAAEFFRGEDRTGVCP